MQLCFQNITLTFDLGVHDLQMCRSSRSVERQGLRDPFSQAAKLCFLFRELLLYRSALSEKLRPGTLHCVIDQQMFIRIQEHPGQVLRMPSDIIIHPGC